MDSDPLLSVFGRWRLEEGEDIIDLADYGHVPEGPGCLLVSQKWHFGFDWTGGRPGLFFSSRRGLTGDLETRMAGAIRGCLEKSSRLLREKEIPAAVEPRLGELEVVVNDRLFAANTDEGDRLVRPALVAVLDRLYGNGGYTIEREADPGRRLGYHVTAARSEGLSIDGMVAALSD